MKVFVDTSVWFAASTSSEKGHKYASQIILSEHELVTTAFVLLETWQLTKVRVGLDAAENLVKKIALIAPPIPLNENDLEIAFSIQEGYADQNFSLVDRVSFAVMKREGITKVATFDSDFFIYRFGPKNKYHFEQAISGDRRDGP